MQISEPASKQRTKLPLWIRLLSRIWIKKGRERKGRRGASVRWRERKALSRQERVCSEGVRSQRYHSEDQKCLGRDMCASEVDIVSIVYPIVAWNQLKYPGTRMHCPSTAPLPNQPSVKAIRSTENSVSKKSNLITAS